MTAREARRALGSRKVRKQDRKMQRFMKDRPKQRKNSLPGGYLPPKS